jgi:hypothetical protein
VKFYEVVTKRSVGSAVAELWRRERTLFDLGKLGLGLALVCAVIAALNGGWLILPEGRLLEAAKFDAAFGIYFLTLALIVPFAGMTARGRRRWLVWTMWIAIFSFALENIQTWRGLNPRFSRVAGPIDQALGGVFFLLALAVAVTFVILAARFFRSDTLADHPPLRVAFRYAAIASLVAFSIGVVMVSVQGRAVAGAGNLMPLHASGFHGLQAIPLVALLLGWSRMPTAGALRCVHAAGISWLVVCAGLLAQALAGIAPLTPTLPLAVSVIGAALWGAALAFAWRVSRDGDAMPMATS